MGKGKILVWKKVLFTFIQLFEIKDFFSSLYSDDVKSFSNIHCSHIEK